MRRFALSLLPLQATISSMVLKQPRQVALSSRQQLRMQGEGTALSDTAACRCAGSGIDINAGGLGRCGRLAPGSAAIPAVPAVMLAAGVEGDRQLLPASVVPAPLAAAPLPAWGSTTVTRLADLQRMGGRITRHRVQLAGTGGNRALGSQPLHAGVFGNEA
jgi:hypothetical protein